MTDEFSDQIVAALPRLRGFAMALTRNRADADDLVQQTCERALGARDRFIPGTSMQSWLFRILRNLQIDGVRRRRPHAPIDDEAVADTLVGEDGRETSEARLVAKRVEALVDALPEDQRAVIVLVCVEGLKYREVAEMLDIPLGTVMSRLSRARLAVAEGLESNVVAFGPKASGAATE